MTPSMARLATLQDRERALTLTNDEAAEFTALRQRLATEEQEVADDPKTLLVDEARRPLITGEDNPATPEDESDYLGALQSKDARERERVAMLYLRKALALLEPLAMALLKTALTNGVKLLDAPAPLAPLVEVVRGAAEDAARVVLDDVRP